MTRRREFSAPIRRAAYERSGGYCETGRIPQMPKVGCGVRLTSGNIWYEHIICDGINGDPTLENCAVLCKTCGLSKTKSYDLPIVADAKRQWDRHRGIKSVSQRLPGNKFDPRKKKLNGQVVNRETGEPWGVRQS